jgi:hypothetical protein
MVMTGNFKENGNSRVGSFPFFNRGKIRGLYANDFGRLPKSIKCFFFIYVTASTGFSDLELNPAVSIIAKNFV